MEQDQDVPEKKTCTTAIQGDWVKIHKILLSPDERSSKIPDDTKQVPLEMWMNGFLRQEGASVGDEVEIITAIGRKERGVLVAINPGYAHSFGNTIPELILVGKQLRSLLRETE